MSLITALIIGVFLGIAVVMIASYYENQSRIEHFINRKNTLELELNLIKSKLNHLQELATPTIKQKAEIHIHEKVLELSSNDLEKIKVVIKQLHDFYHDNYTDHQPNYKRNFNENSMKIWSPLDLLKVLLVLNEAVHNALVHSSSSFIFNIVTLEEDKHQFIVHDNGCGFNTELDYTAGGIHRMKALTKELNANLQISSTLEIGTKVTLTL